MALQKAFTAELLELEVCGGVAVRCYAGGVSPGPDSPRPLLLLHSINAAPSAMEMKPLFEHFAPQRPVFAPDLPGFGLSQRGDLPYSPDFYAQAIADVVKQLKGPPPDVVALSLTCEFAARAVSQLGAQIRSLPNLAHRSRPPAATAAGDRGAYQSSTPGRLDRKHALASFGVQAKHPLFSGPGILWLCPRGTGGLCGCYGEGLGRCQRSLQLPDHATVHP